MSPRRHAYTTIVIIITNLNNDILTRNHETHCIIFFYFKTSVKATTKRTTFNNRNAVTRKMLCNPLYMGISISVNQRPVPALHTSKQRHRKSPVYRLPEHGRPAAVQLPVYKAHQNDQSWLPGERICGLDGGRVS